MLRCQRIAAAVFGVTLLAACSESSHSQTSNTKTPRSVASSHSVLPAGDSTEAGKPGTVAVAAANARTGKFLWRVPVNGDFQVFSGMVLDGESLYGQWASCDNNHAGVAAIDLATGHVRWRTDTLYQGETLPNALLQSALGGLYVTAGGGTNESDHSVTITAVDIANGKVRWTRKLADPVGQGGLALDQAVVAVATGPEGAPGGTITALDRATGQVLWTSPLPTGAATWSSIAADNDHIYATHMGNPTDPSKADFQETTLAFTAHTGKLVWKHDGRAPRPSRPGGQVVALEMVPTGPSDSPSLIGLDSDTGAQRWQRPGLGSLGDRSDTADGRVVMGGPPGGVHVVDIATGKDAWSPPPGDVVATRANGIVFDDGHGHSTLYDAATGARIGAPAQLPQENDQVTVAPQIDADGRLILARGCPGRG
jgi:outer membrane protein assembly factor BamB